MADLLRLAMIQILIGAVLISFSSVFVKLVHVGPTSALFYRFLFGAAALFTYAFLARIALWRGLKTMGYAAAAGFLFSLDLFLWHRSILYIGPGLATLLANFQVFILSAVGILFLSERFRFAFIASVAMAFAGLSLVVGLDWSGMDESFRIGILFALLAAFCYAGITLTIQTSQRLPVILTPIANMAWLCFFGALFGSVEVWLSAESFYIPDLYSLGFLAAYGVVCSGLGWYLITSGLPHVPVSLAGLSLILQPTLAFVWDVLFFDKPVTAWNLVGALMILAAIYWGVLIRSR